MRPFRFFATVDNNLGFAELTTRQVKQMPDNLHTLSSHESTDRGCQGTGRSMPIIAQR